MRDIKFRAWDKKKKCLTTGNGNYMLDCIGNVYWQFGNDEPKMIDREDIELMQYTGLKDKNGVEIYEGDILKKKDTLRPFVVGFHENTGQFKMYWERMDVYRSSIYPTVQVEVIGNIYENPELLEVK